MAEQRCPHGFLLSQVSCPQCAPSKPRPAREALKLDQVQGALRETDSIMQAAKRLGCTKQGLNYWLRAHPELREIVNEQTERRRHKAVFGKAAE